MRDMSPWARKSAALAILGAVLFAIYLVMIAPVLDNAAARQDELTRLQGLSERYARAVQEVPALEAQLTALQTRDHGDGVLTDSSETQAVAAMQSRLKSSVLEAGGQLQSVEVLAADHAGKRSKISVRARVAIALDGLQRVMAALNETPPVLFIETLDVRQPDGGRAREQITPGALDVDVTVYGYLRGNT